MLKASYGENAVTTATPVETTGYQRAMSFLVQRRPSVADAQVDHETRHQNI